MRRRHHSGLFLATVVGGSQALQAASFTNLNFESASVSSAPANYIPAEASPAISASAALPGWTAHEDNTTVTALWGSPVSALDFTSIVLITTTNGYPTPAAEPPIEGNFSIELNSLAAPGNNYYQTSSISQMATVPAGTKSIQFLIRQPPIGISTACIPYVFMNGDSIPVSPISSSGGIVTWGGDISTYAGADATLMIESAGDPNAPAPPTHAPGPGPQNEDVFDLDAITFSTTAVPEPAADLFMLAGFLPLLMRNRTPHTRA